MEKLDAYFKLQKEIWEQFGYEENYRKFPMIDHRDLLWSCDGDAVVSAEKLEHFATGDYWEDDVYKQRFLTKWVYRAEECTMILIDTHTDLNVYLAIFDNAKEIKKPVEA